MIHKATSYSKILESTIVAFFICSAEFTVSVELLWNGIQCLIKLFLVSVSAFIVREKMHKSKPKESYAISNWYHSDDCTKTISTSHSPHEFQDNISRMSFGHLWMKKAKKNSLFILFRYSSDNMFGDSIFFFSKNAFEYEESSNDDVIGVIPCHEHLYLLTVNDISSNYGKFYLNITIRSRKLSGNEVYHNYRLISSMRSSEMRTRNI